MPTDKRILIVGASTRAAAMSACRAGYEPWTADLFADADLCRLGPVWELENWPPPTESIPPCTANIPWLYTGGIENWPDFVVEVSLRRPLRGNGGATLQSAADPAALANTLQKADLPHAAVTFDVDAVPTEGSWLWKPLRSGGGLGIHPWLGTQENGARSGYFQQRLAGIVAGATFVANAGTAHLLGVCEMPPEFASPEMSPFMYAGSLGPIRLTEPQRADLQRLGQVLAKALGLVGLFGVDGIWQDDRFHVIELNPRYTASVEVLERAHGGSAFALHMAACSGEPITGLLDLWHGTTPRCCGKQILYARRTLSITQAMSARLLSLAKTPLQPLVADIPRGGTTVPGGAPLLTVLADVADRDAVIATLAERATLTRAIVNDG